MCYGSFVHQLYSLNSSHRSETQNFPCQIAENLTQMNAAPLSEEGHGFPAPGPGTNLSCLECLVAFIARM